MPQISFALFNKVVFDIFYILIEFHFLVVRVCLCCRPAAPGGGRQRGVALALMVFKFVVSLSSPK